MNKQNKKYNVWIVDDEQGMCRGVTCALDNYTADLEECDESVGFSVCTFDSGEAFLAALEQKTPDILLLDNKLPGIEGIEILKHLSEKNVSVLTIMITAYATFDRAVRATKLGAYDFLAKPFTPDELRYTLRKACRNLVLTEKARQLEKEKRNVRFEFISVLAHELKSPLNAIEGYADILKNRSAGDTLDAYDHMISRIKVRIGGMRKLIADLLDLTSIESGQKKRMLEPVDIAETIQEIIENCKELADEKKVHINLCAHDQSVYNADKSEIEMVFTNFITNSIKYNKDNGTVSIDIRKDAGAVMVSISDTGIGMSEDEQKKLFKEFSRIKNAKTRNIQGSGLGLSIIHKILALYGAQIEVKSKPDEGTTFCVTLPFVQ